MSTAQAVPVVAAVILNEKKQILITQRAQGRHLAGMWEFPGGKIDAEESPEQALVREIREELDIDISVEKLIWHNTFSYPTKTINIMFYFCKLLSSGEQIKALEVADFKWVYPDDLSEFDFPPADDFFIHKLRNNFFHIIAK